MGWSLRVCLFGGILGKKRIENWGNSIFSGCLVRKKGIPSDLPKCFLPKMGRKLNSPCDEKCHMGYTFLCQLLYLFLFLFPLVFIFFVFVTVSPCYHKFPPFFFSFFFFFWLFLCFSLVLFFLFFAHLPLACAIFFFFFKWSVHKHVFFYSMWT